MKTITFFFTILLFLASCTGIEKKEYQLPKKISLSSYGFFDPFYAEQILEPPLRSFNMWDDSLLSLCGIYHIEFINRGVKSPVDIHEKADYQFNRSGFPINYTYYNFELSQDVYTQIEFNTLKKGVVSFNVPIFYGKKDKQFVNVTKTAECLLSVRKKENLEFDSSFVYFEDNKPVVYIEKIGNFVSKVHFILDIHKSLSGLKGLLPKYHITADEFLLAEKTITFTEQNLPKKSYHITENFIKEELTAEWNYENNKKLTNFRKYINNHLVKDISFNFSDDKVLRSFTYNRKQYEIHYN